MRTEYLINEQPISIGDTLTIGTYGEVTVRRLEADHIVVLTGDQRERVVYASRLSTEAPQITISRLPEVGYFHRDTGLPIRAHDATAGGIVEGVYDDVLRFERGLTAAGTTEEFHRFVEVDPSVENLNYGVEIRVHPTADELANGLTREVRADGESCVEIDGALVPVTDVVWLAGAYHLISECKLLAGWETRYVLDVTGMILLCDGRYALPDEAVEINYGPRLGSRVYLADARPTYDGFIVPVDEAITCLNEYGQESFRAEAPAGWVELTAGVWARESYLRECCRTGRVIHSAHAVHLDNDDIVCREWAEAHTRRCEECGVNFETTGEGSCECPRCRLSARTRIRNYSNRLASFFPAEEDIPLKFGIELEVGCDRGFHRSICTSVMADALDLSGTPVETYAIFKEDGSLSSCDGFEIVSRPDSPAVHKRIWDAALSDPAVSRHMSSFNNGKCGIHIHVSRAPLTQLWIGRLLVLINSPANRPVIHKIAGRGPNDYTRYYNKKLSDGKYYGSERYEALNTVGDNTIEFRVFRGTLNHDSFLKNIEFVEAAMEFTRPSARSIRDMDTPDAFLDFIKKSRKSYPYLFGFLVGRNVIAK